MKGALRFLLVLILGQAAAQLSGGTAREKTLIVIFLTPLLMGVATLAFLGASAWYVFHSERVEAEVVRVYEWTGTTIFDRGVTNCEPIFTFMQNGEERLAASRHAHHSYCVAVGERVMIRAIPGGTGDVKLDIWQGLWFIPAMLAWMTLACFFVAMLVWRVVDRLIFARRRS